MSRFSVLLAGLLPACTAIDVTIDPARFAELIEFEDARPGAGPIPTTHPSDEEHPAADQIDAPTTVAVGQVFTIRLTTRTEDPLAVSGVVAGADGDSGTS